MFQGKVKPLAMTIAGARDPAKSNEFKTDPGMIAHSLRIEIWDSAFLIWTG
jgi:hypothetical protein